MYGKIRRKEMYLLRKLGIPLAAILILSILALITVVLIYEQNGLIIPSFELPKNEQPETTVAPETTVSAELKTVNNYIPMSGGILK